jgi:lipopolysaccharide assembly outer membrane protein LptD (OstA)
MGENMELAADEAEYNQTTGEIALFGTVVLRQLHRRLTQVIPATNPGGVALPEPKDVVVRIRGNFQIAIGELTIEANEADVNTETGETELRGNVKLTRPKK